MANFSTNVILIWSGTNANIPSGWERVTALSESGGGSYYPKGTANGVNPNGTGGSATHTHTSSTHVHTMANHTHTVTINAATGTVHTNCSATPEAAAENHTHAATASGNPASVSVEAVAVTYGAFSSDPPYFEVIYIKPSTQTNFIPDNVIFLWDSATAPTESSFKFCNGGDSTTDLRNKYLKGAANTNAGATGGTTENVHAIDHDHDVSHTHASATSGGSQQCRDSQGTGTCMACAHTHAFTLAACTTGTATDDLDCTCVETVEPAYTKLMAYQNKAGVSRRPVRGVIGLWLGTLANIPSNWKLCDGAGGTTDMRGRHLKITADSSELADTGGSNTHTHASVNHTHAAVSHITGHTTGNLTHTSSNLQPDGSGGNLVRSDAVHTTSVSTETYALNAGGTTAESSNNEPTYRTVAFIKLVAIYGGAFLLNMLS